MGAGKTTLGRVFAQSIHAQFIDLDTLIQIKAGKMITDIFDEIGEEGFRKIEYGVLKNLIFSRPTIIATGGGTPCFGNNFELMNKNGLSIFLNVEFDVLMKRLLNDKANRPLVINSGQKEIESLYMKRLKCYKKADLTIDCQDDIKISSMISKLVNELKSVI
jgi:shikimate kinase